MSDETTEGMSSGDLLIKVGCWIKDGKDIECHDGSGQWHAAGLDVIHTRGRIYRAKPRKPRVTELLLGYQAVEITPEVRAVLEREGLL